MIPSLLLAAVITASPIQTEASWYGQECAQRPMANGEAFNPDRFTAASWDYPLGTALQVVSIDTGAAVEVIVTDRGPAKRLVEMGRRLDLSQAAFERIADLDRGVAKVSIIKLPGARR